MRIAFSKASGAPKYERYIEWLRSVDPTLEPVDLSRTSEPLQALAQCAGLVLTGGPDIAPERYGHPEYEQFCTEPPAPERDELEFALVHEALERYRLPVLGICRGAQLLNVALGGTLWADLEQQYPGRPLLRHWKSEEQDSVHRVLLEPATLLYKYTKVDEADVASAHHQAVAELAPLLRVCAVAEDGVIEAFEWAEPSGRGFLLAVQWHPERMDWRHPLSGTLAERFLREAESYALLFQP